MEDRRVVKSVVMEPLVTVPHVSPAKPIENQSEPKEEAHSIPQESLAVGSNITEESSFEVEKILTNAIVGEEEKLHKESVEEENRQREEILEQMDKKHKEQCFKRLLHLLDRSSFYAQFLLNKMEKQQKEEHQKSEKHKIKVLQQKSENHDEMKRTTKLAVSNIQDTENPIAHKKDDGKEAPPRGRGRRRKRKENEHDNQDSEGKHSVKNISEKGSKRRREEKEDISLADVLDKEDLTKRVQMNLDCPTEKELAKPAETDRFSRVYEGNAVSDRQPELLSGGVMRLYQLEGFEWLKVLYENGVNGILADEMGLGKTIQCIALIAHLIEMGVPGPFFICAPLSTLPNWISEFHRFVPLVPVTLYHGTPEERAVLRKKIGKSYTVIGKSVHAVVLTSYEITIRDRNLLQNFEWRYIIVDEGHRMKNFQCRLIRELKKYRSVNRLLLTGTPLQNNLSELWSLLNFLLPEIFDDLQIFESWFDISYLMKEGVDEEIVAQEQEKQIIATMHQILSPFLLRRTKADVDLMLPPKKELIVYAPLSALQKKFYESTVNKTIQGVLAKQQEEEDIKFDDKGRPKRNCKQKIKYGDMRDSDFEKMLHGEYEDTNDDSSNTSSTVPIQKSVETSVVSLKMQNILMQLRKICNHPYLLEYPLDPLTQNFKIDEELVKVCGKISLMDSLLKELKKHGHKVLLFSQMTTMLDILQDYCNLRKFKFSRLDGSMPVNDRQQQIQNFNEDPDIFIFLLSTRAGGLGINLTAADTVIIYDSDWNPQCDLQAQDRCHRIGQTKPVIVYRLVTANTIDQKIVERAAAKRKLEKMIIQKGKFTTGCNAFMKSHQPIRAKELLELLQSKDHEGVVKFSDGMRFSKQELDLLLDRSDMVNRSQKTNSLKEVDRLFKVIDIQGTVN
ncbi:lymphocyte-specific helicase-like isoform X2 [Tachypleus tridentatus]|uniref:lymphocyte-specific helicase-like isoform X2 n=1 Tax=Tachypleus tridentatus TaxID=6853 RepID=UPI003FD4A20C